MYLKTFSDPKKKIDEKYILSKTKILCGQLVEKVIIAHF